MNHMCSAGRSSRHARAATTVAALLTTLTGHTLAASGDVLSAMLIDETLTPRKVTLVGFDGNQVIFLDQQGLERRIGQDRLTALVAIEASTDLRDGLGAAAHRAFDGFETAPDPSASAASGLVRLVDGRRFPGESEPSPSFEETVIWHHQRFGELRIPLDAISALMQAGWQGWHDAATDHDTPVEDELYLLNGDVLRGFLVGLSDPVEFETGDDIVELETGRIGGIRLANAPETISGMVVWLNDGTVATLDRIASRQDRNLVLTLPEGQAGVYEVSEVRGLAFDAARIRPLAALTPDSQEP
ncbi:MAG: hypothetical protein KDA21_00435, partial [Phycisphaerales bacterium]|nr:hypothetical protein [Phycisphaerales bacterium]